MKGGAAASSQPWLRALAVAHAGTRTALGLALLLAPRKVAEPWLGVGVTRAGGRTALNAFAVRDAAIGVGLLWSIHRGHSVRHWFRLGIALEAVDSGATYIRRRELPASRTPDAWAALGVIGLLGGIVLAVCIDEADPAWR